MAATRASGTNAVRYGTMRDNVMSLKVVLANGEIMTTATRARKSSSGYDLTRLMVGSEGTLGVITELTLKLHGIPEAIGAAICPFPSVEAACNATILTIQSGIPVARIELLDELQVKACNAYSKLTLAGDGRCCCSNSTAPRPASPSNRSVSARSRPTSAAARSNGPPRPRSARGSGRRAMTAISPPARFGPAPVRSRPMSACRSRRLAECVTETQREVAERKLVAPIVGHVGDGNFHVALMVDTEDAAEMKQVKAFMERLTERAIEMGGTCTGEHGVGQGKMKYLLAEHGAPAMAAMRAIKKALDPDNIMNPGKMLPAE